MNLREEHRSSFSDEKQCLGLTTQEVKERICKGLVNGETRAKTKSYRRIFSEHIFTLFNLINVILLAGILLSGSLKNALFFLIVIWNFLIGIFQEIRAKRTIERLSLLSEPKASVYRNGVLAELPAKDLVLDDVMILKAGNQVCVDVVILDGQCQVNESLLTGESVPVTKNKGDHLLSGSYLTAGQTTARAEHVGAENYVNQLTSDAAAYKKPHSIIMSSVQSIVRVIAVCLIPITGFFVWNNFFRISQEFSVAMVKTVAVVSSMIPGGLVLLVSVVLAVSVIRLSRHHTLVQDLYSVENLARVDTLLLDKTGTITEGVLSVEDVVISEESASLNLNKKEITDLIRYYLNHNPDDNSTTRALRKYFQNERRSDNSSGETRFPVSGRFTSAEGGDAGASMTETDVRVTPFSSERKWGMVSVEGTCDLILGAPDVILRGWHDAALEQTKCYTQKGKRVVLFAFSSHGKTDSKSSNECEDSAKISDAITEELPEDVIPAALIVISDQIRKTAPETFGYFREEGVCIKVISGDDPQTASFIAKEAGLAHADRWVDVSDLASEEELRKAVSDFTVFGRVTPDLKQQIVRSLQADGHIVAMTGDGANDVLALRDADCSIAMQSGSDAARSIANMILMDSDFSSLPLVLAEGRKSINNLQRSASLYLTKTTYSIIFAILFTLSTGISYPFENIQITLIGAMTIGIPSFFLALEPNARRIRRHFLWNVFKMAIPAGMLEAGALVAVTVILKSRPGITNAELSSASVYLMLFVGILVILGICGKLNLWKIGLIAGLSAASFAIVTLFQELFSLTAISADSLLVIIGISAAFYAVYEAVLWLALPRIERRSSKNKTESLMNVIHQNGTTADAKNQNRYR